MSAKFSSAPQPTPRIDSSGIDSRSFSVYPIVLATCSQDVVKEHASVLPQPHWLGMQQDSELPLNAILAFAFLYHPLSYVLSFALCLPKKLFKLSRRNNNS